MNICGDSLKYINKDCFSITYNLQNRFQSMCSIYFIPDGDHFQDIYSHKVEVLGLVIMRDPAIAKAEYQADERAVIKIQDFQHEVLPLYFY